MKIERLIVVGCGGIGSHFVPLALRLLRYGGEPFWKRTEFIDGDKYEEKNLHRQSFDAALLGENKASVMSEAYEYLFPDAHTIDVTNRYVEHDEDFASILARGTSEQKDDEWTFVGLCLDNDATRKMVYEACRMVKANVVVVDMANELYTGDVIVWVHTKDGKEICPYPPAFYPNIGEPKDRPPQAYCQMAAPDTPQIVTANAMAAVVGADYLFRMLRDMPIKAQVSFDLNPAKSDTMMWRA